MHVGAIDATYIRQSSTGEKVPGRERESNGSKLLLADNANATSPRSEFFAIKNYASDNELLGEQAEVFVEGCMNIDR